MLDRNYCNLMFNDQFSVFLYLFLLFFFFFLGGGGWGWIWVLVASVPDRCIILDFFSLWLFETVHATHIFKRFELLSSKIFLVFKP